DILTLLFSIEAMEEFRKIDNCLLPTGITILQCNWKRKVVAICFLLHGLLCMSSIAFTDILDNLKWRNTRSNLFIFSTFVLFTEIWIFYIIFFLKRSKMNKFVNRLDKLINRNQGHDLQRLSKRMVVLIVSITLFSTLVLCPYNNQTV